MKRTTIYGFLTTFVAATIFIAACTKDESDVRLDPKLSTSQVSGIKSDSATVVGFVIATGDGFSERGICFNTETMPTTANTKVIYTGAFSQATFAVKLGGLSYATKYYARAYGINASGTYYGDEITFTTLPVVPTLTTSEISSITGNAAAGGGNVTNSGGADVTVRGVCFSTNHNPTVADDTTSNGTGTGEFTSALTNLLGNTTYYVRSYAVNSAGAGYGPEVSFTTLVDLPKVTTASVTGITKVSAISGGTVTYDGGGTITARGLAWSLNENPTTTDNVIAGGTGTGVFVSNLIGLTKNTTYHVRAYATNSAGTAYGNDIAFTTQGDIVTLWIAGDFQGWDPASAKDSLMNTLTDPIVQGYAYIPNTNGFKFVSQKNWDGPNYGAGTTAGTLSTAANSDNITVPEPGYYLFKLDLTNLTYTATKTTWGVIGDATAGGWGSDQTMTYSSHFKRWFATIPLTVNPMKFRANSGWDINYGDNGADGKLEAGGDNIAVAKAGTYSVMLNLSSPNNYKYALMQWSITGDAAGGWGTDIDMTANSNNIWTLTTTLSAGDFKFRANHDWTYNLGGTPNNLSWGGDNIHISTAGTYTITLDLINGTYTIL
jgi:hypothetical protein